MQGAVITERGAQQSEVAGDADQAEADDQHPRDRAAAKRHRQRGVQPLCGGLRRAHVRAHRDVHADVAGQARENRANGESARRGPGPESETDHDEQDQADDQDGAVLTVQVRARAGLNGRCDLLHAGVACRQAQYRHHRDDAVDNGEHTGCDRQPQPCRGIHHASPLKSISCGLRQGRTFEFEIARPARQKRPRTISFKP